MMCLQIPIVLWTGDRNYISELPNMQVMNLLSEIHMLNHYSQNPTSMRLTFSLRNSNSKAPGIYFFKLNFLKQAAGHCTERWENI